MGIHINMHPARKINVRARSSNKWPTISVAAFAISVLVLSSSEGLAATVKNEVIGFLALIPILPVVLAHVG